MLSVASEVFQKEITYARERENEAIKLSKVLQVCFSSVFPKGFVNDKKLKWTATSDA